MDQTRAFTETNEYSHPNQKERKTKYETPKMLKHSCSFGGSANARLAFISLGAIYIHH